MTKIYKTAVIFCSIIIIVVAVLVCYRSLAKDKQGLSGKDVADAKKTVQGFIDAHNSADLDKCIYYTVVPIQGVYNNPSVPEEKIFAYSYDIDNLIYDPDSVLYSAGSQLFTQHGIPSGDGIFLYTDFTPSLKDGRENGSWNSDEVYGSFGFWLIKDDREWKIMDYGM